MKILRASDHKVQPWKNGGGVTREIAAHPPDAGMADFDWRLSSALVSADGPFSSFPGIDRTLLVLDRGALGLAINGAPEAWVTPQSEPVVFPGEAKVFGRLRHGPVIDLNIMVRRGRWSCRARRAAFTAEARIELAADVGFVFAAGELRIGQDRPDHALRSGEAARLDAGESIAVEPADGEARVIVIALSREKQR